MKVSINWLRKFVDVSETPAELAEMLTMLGLEAEVGLDFSGFDNIISAKVLSSTKHPNADKLKLCQVFDGKDTYQVVCGAPNVNADQTVIFAKTGSVLPGDFKIKKVKIRGEKSTGMICSEKELGISDEHEGILVIPDNTEPGMHISEVLNPVFSSLELDILPNRPDALSHLGIAREIAIKTGRRLQKLEILSNLNPKTKSETVQVHIDDPDGCPRYIAGVVKNVKVGPSPEWMGDALKCAGMRPINNLVDISNYVLLEMGHPTHIFDFEKFPEKTVCVRKAKKGEKFITLDEEKHTLNAEHLLITNGKTPVALAGIMGGLDSAVAETTSTVLIESAYFDPVTIRKGSKTLGMLTESSRRFERGADPEGAVTAFWRIVTLLKELTGGELASEMVDSYPKKIKPPSIIFRKSKLENIGGFPIPVKFIEKTLTSLEIDWKKSSKEEWKCIPPSFRPDLERESDLVEEMIRIHGYDLVPAAQSFTSLFTYDAPDPMASTGKIHNCLTGLGYRQCFHNTFQSKKIASISGKTTVAVVNPLSVLMSDIRTSLLPGLLETIDYNIKNGTSNLQLYEMGQVHSQEKKGFDGIIEKGALCGVVHGLIHKKGVHVDDDREQSFFSIKGHINVLLKQLVHLEANYQECEHPEFDQCFTVSAGDQSIGVAGIVSSRIVQALKLEIGEVFAFMFDLEQFVNVIDALLPFKAISPFPIAERELNFVLKEDIQAGEIKNQIIRSGKGLIKHIEPVNIFLHDSLGKGMKSILFKLVFQSDIKTLEDKEVNPIIDEIISVVGNKFGGKLRA